MSLKKDFRTIAGCVRHVTRGAEWHPDVVGVRAAALAVEEGVPAGTALRLMRPALMTVLGRNIETGRLHLGAWSRRT